MDNLVSQISWLSLTQSQLCLYLIMIVYISDHTIRLKLGIKYCSKAISLNKQTIENKTNRNLACVIFLLCVYPRICNYGILIILYLMMHYYISYIQLIGLPAW